MLDYRRRIVDEELDQLLPSLLALAIEGAKGVGKTATAQQRAQTVHRLDDPAVAEVAAADQRRLTTGAPPILIDEWQRLPSSWDLVRRSVDDGAGPGTFLLTGSASPVNYPTHTGAGRIPTVRMSPLAIAERGLTEPTVSLRSLLRGGATIAGSTEVALEDYVREIIGSGFPGIRPLADRALRTQLNGYLDRITERDFPEQGLAVRRPATLRRWMQAYAAAVSSTASYELIRDASTAGDGKKPAKSTTQPYRDVLEKLWILDPVPAWTTSNNRLRRLAQAPKHQLVDPALAARLLGVDAEHLLSGKQAGPSIPRDGTLLGALFESLVTQSVRVYAQAAEASVAHLRTRNGDHEVDLVVERPDGAVVGVEVKLARTAGTDDTKHLRWLRAELGERFVDGVVVTAGSDAFRRPEDGMAVVPLALLGP